MITPQQVVESYSPDGVAAFWKVGTAQKLFATAPGRAGNHSTATFGAHIGNIDDDGKYGQSYKHLTNDITAIARVAEESLSDTRQQNRHRRRR